MDTVFSGSFQTDGTVKELIERVLALRPQGSTFIRISDSKNTVNGRIYLKDGTCVTGAVILPPSQENNYPALKALVAVEEGSYALMTIGEEDDIKMEQSLNIDLMALLKNLGNLPADPAVLMAQTPVASAVPAQSADANVASYQIESGPEQPVPAGAQGGNGHALTLAADKGSPGQPPPPEVDAELKRLLASRFSKNLALGMETSKGPSNTFSRTRNFENSAGTRKSLMLAGAGLVLVLIAATCLWMFSDATNLASRLIPKNFLSSPNQPPGEVSSMKPRGTNNPTAHRKKT
jgi:hypothetical protein